MLAQQTSAAKRALTAFGRRLEVVQCPRARAGEVDRERLPCDRSCMLQGLGRKGEGRPDSVLARLESCHVRIRNFLALAGSLCTVGYPPAEVGSAAESVRRYFSVGFPQHVVDEDACVLPRLGDAEAAERVHTEHERDDADIASLVALAEAIGYEPDSDALKTQLGVLVERLAPRMEAHLVFEEQVMFPLVRALPPEVERTIFADMEARREARRAGRS